MIGRQWDEADSEVKRIQAEVDKWNKLLLEAIKTRELIGIKIGLLGLPVRMASTREREILKLIVDRKSNKEIGWILHISESTVKFHMRNILDKFKVKSRYEINRTLIERGGLCEENTDGSVPIPIRNSAS